MIAKALLEADPTLGTDVKDVRALLRTQYPPTVTDVDRDVMLDVVERVLALVTSTPGKVPLTLVVLDEMQQYIGDDDDKALDVQFLVEDCTSRFANRLLIVATGQAELIATSTLQKLTDRYTVPVALSSNDVETVVREVVLQKKPEEVAGLETVLNGASGEIDSHLGGTQLAPKPADEADLVADYPLLPTRRRFWEAALRAIDRTTKAGTLRTQLRIVHEAAAAVADRPVGHVVGADFLYFEQSIGMRHTGVLLKEVDERISALRVEGGDSELQARLCALVFLIEQIPAEAFGAGGLRATAPFLADLLVEDLPAGGAGLRKQVPGLLDALVTDGHLMAIDDEYRLQTEEGALWEKAFQVSRTKFLADATLLHDRRHERIEAAVVPTVAQVRPLQGASKTPRRVKVDWGDAEPVHEDGSVPVWVRDEWTVKATDVTNAAAAAGADSPTVFVLLPKLDADEIRAALAGHAAAEEVLRRPSPQTDEGKAAQRAMRTRLANEEERLVTLFGQVAAGARVFLGGTGELTTTSLGTGVAAAADKAAIRLFPKFPAGDHPAADWAKVVKAAQDGAPDAFAKVGHAGPPTTHPIGKEVLAAVLPAGVKGTDLQKRFEGAPYGWPKEAVRGALLALVAGGHVRASLDGQDAGVKQLNPSQLGKVTFHLEDPPPTGMQRQAVKALLAAAGIAVDPGHEGSQIPALVQQMKALANRAGGAPPLPEAPSTAHLDDLMARSGNERFKAVADDHARLSGALQSWQAAGDRRDRREAAWRDLSRLLGHAAGLPIASTVAPAVAAIDSGRQLLDDPDPVTPLLGDVAGALRAEVTALADELAEARRAAVAELEAWEGWAALADDDRQVVLGAHDLVVEPAPATASVADVLVALDTIPLAAWHDRIGLVPTRRDQAHMQAATILEPASVTVDLPKATVKSPDDLAAYLAAVEAVVAPHLAAGRTVQL